MFSRNPSAEGRPSAGGSNLWHGKRQDSATPARIRANHSQPAPLASMDADADERAYLPASSGFLS